MLTASDKLQREEAPVPHEFPQDSALPGWGPVCRSSSWGTNRA